MLEQELGAEHIDLVIPFKNNPNPRAKGVERGFKKHEIPHMKEVMSHINKNGYGFDNFYIDFE